MSWRSFLVLSRNEDVSRQKNSLEENVKEASGWKIKATLPTRLHCDIQ